MTITAQTSKTGPYSGNGSTVVFAYTFEVQDEAHLVVTLADADGKETTQTLTTDYTVTGVGEASGGSITMSTAPATGESLTISRSIPLTQELDLQNRGAVAPEALEDAYDKLTQIVQDFSEQLGRSLKVSVASANPSDLPTGDRAGQFLAFDASGEPTYASGTGADTDLRADLASGDAGKGAALIEYGGGTVEAALDGLVIGTYVQAFDAGLLSIAGLTTAANKMIYTTGPDTYAVADLTAAGRALLDDADASAQRATLGLGSVAVADLIDDDTMATATATNVSSAEAAKAYVDTQVAAATPASYTDATGQTLDGTLTFTWTHGLGAVPKGLSMWLECLVADRGFSVGDVLYIPATNEGQGSRGTSVWASSTEVGVAFAGYPYVASKTGGAVAVITTNSWRVHVRATL